MRRFFVMRRYTGVGRRPLFVMFQNPDTLAHHHRRVYNFSDTAGSPLTERNWSFTDSGSFIIFTDPDKWVEVAPDKVSEVWVHLNNPGIRQDILEDPVIFAAQISSPTSRPPIKTSNTKHKIGVPKNKLP